MKELYINPEPYAFAGVNVDKAKTSFSIIGVPLDETASFRPGYRFAPFRIRLVSPSLEFYSLRAGIDVEEFLFHDEGDIIISPGNLQAAIDRIFLVASELYRDDRVPIYIGGEHTITYPIIKGIKETVGGDTCSIIFDAHADLRGEYLGLKLSHACVSRRIHELIGNKMFFIGLRALSSEEIKFIKKENLHYLSTMDLRRLTKRDIIRRVIDFMDECNAVHISIDMDVLDPSYAPGVGTPEPDGITPSHLLDILTGIINERVVSMDVVEVNPNYDISDITAFLAAKIILEFAAFKKKFMT